MKPPPGLSQIEDIFHAVLEREPAERAAFLAEACAGDQSLLDAVKALLAAHDQSWSLVDQRHAAIEIVSTSDPTQRQLKPPAPQAIPSPAPYSSSDGQREGRFVTGQMLAGRYRIVSLLGKGGMGEVYKAEDLKLSQTVALKFLPSAVALDGGMLARFHNEVRIARRVAHQNVCRVDAFAGDGGGGGREYRLTSGGGGGVLDCHHHRPGGYGSLPEQDETD
jgi:hypothetical protein